MLHRHFNNKKLINEWFKLSSDDVNNFKNICKQYSNIIHVLKDNPFFNKQKRQLY